MSPPETGRPSERVHHPAYPDGSGEPVHPAEGEVGSQVGSTIDEPVPSPASSGEEGPGRPSAPHSGASSPERGGSQAAGISLGAPPAGDTIQVRSQSAPGPDRDVRRLDPRLRSAVRRVLARLENEHGIEGDVVEGYRSASRQRSLYAQGRTRPGHVVTWTLDSAHMRGRAVDLVLNQQWDDLAPYRVLQEVAAEEGLKTLGMKDPGHLELPVPGEGRRSQEPAPGEARVLRTLARAASVAGVAGRASVARAAHPAVPGISVRSPGQGNPAAPDPVPAAPEAAPPSDPDPIPSPPRPIPAPVHLDVPRSEVARAEAAPSSPSSQEAGPDARPEPVGAGLSTQAGGRAPQGGASALRGASVDLTGRVEQVRQAQEAAEAARPGATIDLGDVDGLGTRVRLNLRGGKVGARIETLDPRLGVALEDKSPVLKSALEARGLEAESIQIRTLSDDGSSIRGANKTIEAVQVGEGARDARDRPRDGTPEQKGSRQEPRPDQFRQRRQREEGQNDR